MQGKKSPQKCCATEKEFPQHSLGPALQLHFSCTRCATQQDCVCLFMGGPWEPNRSQVRASAPPDTQPAKFISSLLVGACPHLTPAGCRYSHPVVDDPITLMADDYCLFSSEVYASESPVWPDEDLSLKVVLNNELFASNAVWFSYTWFCVFLFKIRHMAPKSSKCFFLKKMSWGHCNLSGDVTGLL